MRIQTRLFFVHLSVSPISSFFSLPLLAQRELGRARAGVEDKDVVREPGDDDGVEEVGGHGEAHFFLFGCFWKEKKAEREREEL